MRILFVIIFVLLLAPGISQAANDAGTRSPFGFGVGARELSLGGSGQATCDLFTAPYWNPSRLADAEHMSFGIFHIYLFDTDAAYQYVGGVLPTMDYGTFGIGLFRLGVSGIDKRDINNVSLYEFSDNRQALSLAYARTMSGFNIGLSLYLEHHSLDTYSATSTPGVNFSLSKRFNFFGSLWKNLIIGVNARNVLRPTMTLASEKVRYPIEADMGLALELRPFTGLNHTTLITTSFSKADFVSVQPTVGLEYNINNLLIIRGGFKKHEMTFGTGIKYRGFNFDYAFVEQEMGFLHMFSFATLLGTSVTEKRALRAKLRESEFNGLMNDRLKSQNLAMVERLLSDGREMLNDGDLVKASDNLDRALFLARSSALDTTQIYKLAEEARSRLKDIIQKMEYALYLDSAQIKLENKDFWNAKYFAGLALRQMPNSVEAKQIAETAEAAISTAFSFEEKILRQLRMVDSLLSYGLMEKASIIVDELMKTAPNDKNVRQIYKKLAFEFLKKTIEDEYAFGNHENALAAVDSALIIFPGHRWCLDMQKQIRYEIKTSQAMANSVIPPVNKVELSEELLSEVNDSYESAQSRFKSGDLHAAIKLWEKVERLAPDFQSVRSYLVNAYKFVGVDYYGKNLPDKAIEVWKKAVALDPDNSEIKSYIKRTKAEAKKLRELAHE